MDSFRLKGVVVVKGIGSVSEVVDDRSGDRVFVEFVG